ncbi:MAG TPA: efflux RND transporter periplasmic adaptor subunit [Rhizomicrobium sp.]|jgi:multidrug efflux system membrane fusion protein|nr:efflux RND transporter periplasmic adaptor subunit [Rhizomicrobium sp.]
MNIRISNPLLPAPSAVADTAGEYRHVGNRWALVLGGGVLVLVAALLWHFLSGVPAPPRNQPAPPVNVALVQERNVAGLAHSIGTVVPVSTVQVTALVTGQLLSTGFAEGQIVKAGQVLFQIDPKPFAAALAQARATLARDTAMNASAQNDKTRYMNLAAQGAATAQQRDQAIATAGADAATIEADKAAVQTAELNLGYTRIRSAITGKTGPILIQPGNLITANNNASPLVTITQLQPIKVSMFLPQSDLPRIQAQVGVKKLVMTLRPGGGTPIVAPVNFVGNQVDAKTGTVELRATFDNADFRLVPGQYVDAAVALDDYPNAIVVPRDAVNIGPENRYVYVVGDHEIAAMRTVELIYDDGAIDVIAGNIRPGEKVIVEGQLRVIPGTAVQVMNFPAAVHN